MRRGLLTLVVTCSLALWAGAGAAQSDPIQFILGPPQQVPGGPQFVAIGDINNDGYGDVVASTERSDQVVSLLSDGAGFFTTAITFPVGRRLGDLTLADFNGDGNLDIAAIDERGGVFTISGLGDGRFSSPVFHEGTRRSEAVYVADVDGRNGIDVITANGRDNTISVFLNRGGNRGFDRGVQYGVGGRAVPTDIVVEDFNGDGFPDVAVIDGHLRDVDQVIVMLNNGLGQFLQAFNFIVDDGAQALTVGDFNNDGHLDIATINNGDFRVTQVRRIYTISILLGHGNGVFRTVAPVMYACPSQFNGVPIICFPRDIESGDFNRDGLDDLAVSIDIRTEQDIGVQTPGILDALIGLGDGTFELSTSVQVGLRPRGIAVGDVTGDTLPDVAIAEFGRIGIVRDDDTVSVARAIMPPPRQDGQTCRISEQCASGICLHGICCGSFCENGQRCDVPGYEGTCTDPVENGERCTDGTQCQSGFCVGGFCCGSPQCPPGQFCNTGECGPPAPPGVPCNGDEQCATGNCVDGYCCTTPTCPVDQRCDIPGMEGMCRSTLPIGQPCTQDGQCTSGNCVDNICCSVSECGPGESCAVPGREGICSALPTATPTPTRTPTPKPQGFPCGADGECVSGNCVDDTCCNVPFCPPNQYCNISGSTGTCAPRKPIGSGCNQDTDCQSSNCHLNHPETPLGFAGVCGPQRTPTPIGPGGRCTETADCQPGLFCNERDGFICCNELECPANQTCRDASNPGFCTLLPTPTPTRLPNGERCSENEPQVCASGNCVHQTCCQQAFCVNDDRCDITGFTGRCVPPLGEGALCGKNSDCRGELQCLNLDGTGARCQLRPVTPTMVPTAVPTATTKPIVSARRSGGCAIDDSSSSANGAWLLSLLPLAVWVRRRNQA